MQGRKVYWKLDWEKARGREKSLEIWGARLLNRVGWGELDLSLGGGIWFGFGDLVWRGRRFGRAGFQGSEREVEGEKRVGEGEGGIRMEGGEKWGMEGWKLYCGERNLELGRVE